MPVRAVCGGKTQFVTGFLQRFRFLEIASFTLIGFQANFGTFFMVLPISWLGRIKDAIGVIDKIEILIELSAVRIGSTLQTS